MCWTLLIFKDVFIVNNLILILLAIFIFGLIIFIHEFGHFFTAKLFGVKVNEFCIGMGPKLLNMKRGETTYSIRALPVGGFCDMEGEDEASSDNNSFGNKAVWKRIIIVSAGAIMNLILGFIMMMIILCQRPLFLSTTIASFSENAYSHNNGLEVGDQIVSVDGMSVSTYSDLAFALTVYNQSEFNMGVKRNGQNIKLENVKFDSITAENGKPQIKLDFKVEPIEKNFISLIKQSFLETVSTIKVTYSGLIGMIKGKISFRNMSGPVGIASVIKDTASEGLKISIFTAINNIIYLMAIISISLGIGNLLPLPALDGGRLIFLLFELIFRKQINPKYEGWIHATGFVLIAILMLIITFSDVFRLFGR